MAKGMQIHHSAVLRGPTSRLGGVHNTGVVPAQGAATQPVDKPDDIVAQLAAIQSMKAQ